MASLTLLGLDLIARGYVNNLPDVVERKTFNRDSIISNNFEFECNNISDIFSTNNPKSIFSSADWLYSNVILTDDDNNTIWDGVLIDVKCNHRTKKAYLSTRDNLYAFKDVYIEYESSTWETGAEAAKNIMDSYNFSYYDDPTLSASIDTLIDNSAYMMLNINKSDNMDLFNVLDTIGIHSCADVYSSKGNVFFKVWTNFTASTSLSINIDNTNRLRSNPIVTYLQREMINDYSIDYDGSSDILVTDSTAGNIGALSRAKYGTKALEPMNTGTDKQIIFQDSTTARWIGEQYIKRSNYNLLTNPRPILKIQFDLDIKFKKWIELGTLFKLDLVDENWTDKIFEVFEFRRSESRNNINIVAYEVIT